MTALKIAQRAVPEDDTYWTWSVWIDGPDNELDSIRDVIWKLHPTFSPPIHRVDSRTSKFKLETSGWGEFEINAEVNHKDGQSETLTHWLQLTEDGATAGKISARKQQASGTKASQAARPNVFLSYSLDHADLAAHLSKALKKGRYGVTRDVDVPAGVEFRSWTKDQITKSDAVVVLGADDAHMWRLPEVEIAQSAGVPVLPVTFGKSKILPSQSQQMEPLRVKSGKPADVALNLAQQIGKALL